jgi:Protein of unknown function (DUF3137)
LQDIDTYYNKELLPELELLETERLRIKKNKIIVYLIAAVAAIIALLVSQNFVVPLVFVGLGVLIGTFAFSNKDAAINNAYKQKIVNKAATHFFEGITYQPYTGFSKSRFCDINLFDTEPDRYSCEDLFAGKKEKTTYSFSEVHAEYKTETTHTDKNGHTTTTTNWHDIFKGVIFVADCNKDFSNMVLVKRDSFKIFGSSTRVKMEDPLFEEAFDVYANDDIEARYLITPAFMERFLEIDKKFGGGIMASFHNQEIIITIPFSANNFESSTWSTLLNPNKIKFEINLIYNLIQIVDTLDLNTRIWTKQ